MMTRQRGNEDEQTSRVLCELSSLVLGLLRSSPVGRTPEKISPAGFAAFMVGVSTAMMVCGSVTFFIGFLLMPWVLGLLVLLYVAGVVTTISVIGNSIVSFASPPSLPLPLPEDDIPPWKM